MRHTSRYFSSGGARRIIIVGCGRLGAALANRLSEGGHEVVIVDRTEKSFSKLAPTYSGYKVVGNAVEATTLEEAEVTEATDLFAFTTHDATNLMVAQMASEVYKVEGVIARIYDPINEAIYADFGVKTISPTRVALDAIFSIAELKV